MIVNKVPQYTWNGTWGGNLPHAFVSQGLFAEDMRSAAGYKPSDIALCAVLIDDELHKNDAP